MVIESDSIDFDFVFILFFNKRKKQIDCEWKKSSSRFLMNHHDTQLNFGIRSEKSKNRSTGNKLAGLQVLVRI